MSPRLIFDDIDEFERWVDQFVLKNKYVLYVTEDQEVILVPLRSTQPIVYSYIQLESVDVLKELVKRIQEKTGVRAFKIKRMDWKVDMPIEARISEFEE